MNPRKTQELDRATRQLIGYGVMISVVSRRPGLPVPPELLDFVNDMLPAFRGAVKLPSDQDQLEQLVVQAREDRDDQIRRVRQSLESNGTSPTREEVCQLITRILERRGRLKGDSGFDKIANITADVLGYHPEG